LEEVAEDAWQALLPAFKQMQAGGPAANCPFAFTGTGNGAFVMLLVAARLRAEFGMEPSCIIVTASAPTRRYLTPYGRELLKKADQDPSEFMKTAWPLVEKMYKLGRLPERYYQHCLRSIQQCESFIDRVDHIFYMASCPIYVFVATDVSSPIDARTQEDFAAWSQWTTGPCEVIDPSSKLWQGSAAIDKCWSEFGKHAGVHG